MSATFDAIVKDMMKKRKDSLSNIKTIKKKQTCPYGYRPELRETFNELVKEDTDYVRRYLKTSSNIAYQKDFIIDDKEKFLYKSAFNNDSVYLNFGDIDRILVSCVDSSLASDNYNFYSDIYVNGIKLRKKDYIEMPSTKVYQFKTGVRRFFINADKVNEGDIVSVVIRKEPRFNKSFFTTLTIENSNKQTYFIDKNEIGRYGEILDTNDNEITDLSNLLVYKKSALELDDNYFKLDKNAFVKEYIEYEGDIIGTIGNENIADITSLPTGEVNKGDSYKVVTSGRYGNHLCNEDDILYAISTSDASTDDNWGRIPHNVNETSFILDLTNTVVTNGDVYLIINKSKHIECEYTNDTEMSNDEYLQYLASDSISIPLVDPTITVANCKLPLPVLDINDVEVYVNGYRAINDIDFSFVNDENCNQYIRFTGILEPNSIITYRNKNIYNTYNFYKRCDLDTIDHYVAFNDTFKQLLNDEEIPNYTDVRFVNDELYVIPYKEAYENHRLDFTFVDFIEYTEEVETILNENEDIEFYYTINYDGIDYVMYDSIFGDKENFDIIDGKFVKYDSLIEEMVASKMISVSGLESLKNQVYVKYVEDYAPYKDRLAFLMNTDSDILYSYGIIDLDDKKIPISPVYVEAYLGRTRVPLCNKRGIVNRYLKIDDQHSTFENLELYSEINWTDYAKTVIDMLEGNEIEYDIYGQLKAIDSEYSIVENWLQVVDDIKFNDEEKKDDYNDIFFARFKYIEFDNALSGQKIKLHTYPSLKVLGFYSDHKAGIDITKDCTYKFYDEHDNFLSNDFNTEKVGIQKVVATFVNGNTELTCFVYIEVVELEMESIKVIVNNNFLTTEDNILDAVRILGTYENGSEVFLIPETSRDCTLTLTDPAGNVYDTGYVTEIGAYIITATYGDKVDTVTVLVNDPEDKTIESLDVITNSFVDPDDSSIIDTVLEIYATFSNGNIQKIDNSTVDVFMYEKDSDDNLVDDENGNHKIFNPDKMTELELSTEYKLQIRVYTNSNKETLIMNTNGKEYTDATVKLLNNPLKNAKQIVYCDNSTARLDGDFISKHIDDDNYYYYAIKNLEGTYLSIGQNVLNDGNGIITVNSLAINELVVVEFYNKNTIEVTNKLLFTVMDITSANATILGTFSGNLAQGYEIAINKLDLNEEYDNIDFDEAKLIDKDGNVIVKYNTSLISENNNYTKNGLDNNIYIYFKNFKTNKNYNATGNVTTITDWLLDSKDKGSLTLDLYFDIPSINKTVELHVPNYEKDTNEFNELEYFDEIKVGTTSITINDELNDERWLIIEPDIPYETNVVAIFEIRPNVAYPINVTTSDNTLNFQLRKDETPELEMVLDILRCGLNRYCYITDDGAIYYIDFGITQSEKLAVMSTINDTDIVLTTDEN